MKYENRRKKTKFFAGKGFYIVLALCIVAVGAAAWSAVSTINSSEDYFMSSNYNSSEKLPTSSVSEQVANPVSDVEDTRSEVSSAQDKIQPQTQPQAPVESGPKYVMPLKGNIGKTFSGDTLQYSKTYDDMRLHLGVDLLAKKGTDVVSAAKGTVKKITDDGVWGKMIVMDHGSGIVVHYCGLDGLTVSEGETVAVGTKIGVVGTVPSECEDEDHIHITVTKNGEYISPYDLLKN